MKLTLLHTGVQLGDLDGQAVDTVLERIGTPIKGVGLIKELPENIFSMFTCNTEQERKNTDILNIYDFLTFISAPLHPLHSSGSHTQAKCLLLAYTSTNRTCQTAQIHLMCQLSLESICVSAHSLSILSAGDTKLYGKL